MWDQLMSPPTLKIMDEKLTVSYSELTGWYCITLTHAIHVGLLCCAYTLVGWEVLEVN